MSLVAHQLRYEFKRFWRDPQSVFFTVALPIVFLVIFAGIFGNDTLDSRQNLKVSTYYVPGIITLGVISAAFVGLAISIVEQRERGILKRLRSTPLPPRVYIAARAGTAAVLTLLVTAALVLVGRLAYGVRVPTGALPGLLVTLVLGTACFASLGFAVSGVIRSANAAPAVTNGIALPLQMISGVFFPVDQLPDGLLHIAEVFPVYHLAEGLLDGFDPDGPVAGFGWGHLAVLAAWTAIGLAVAARSFRWEPKPERRT
jgi:ABC-2 type transport system permease protein